VNVEHALLMIHCAAKNPNTHLAVSLREAVDVVLEAQRVAHHAATAGAAQRHDDVLAQRQVRAAAGRRGADVLAEQGHGAVCALQSSYVAPPPVTPTEEGAELDCIAFITVARTLKLKKRSATRWLAEKMLKDRGVAGDDIAMLERIVARINFEYKDTDAQLLANAARAAGATGALGRIVQKLSVITPEDVFNSAMFKALGREGALRARVGAAAAQSRLSIDDDEYAKLFDGFELALKTSLCRCTNVRCSPLMQYVLNIAKLRLEIERDANSTSAPGLLDIMEYGCSVEYAVGLVFAQPGTEARRAVANQIARIAVLMHHHCHNEAERDADLGSMTMFQDEVTKRRYTLHNVLPTVMELLRNSSPIISDMERAVGNQVPQSLIDLVKGKRRRE
jgi:hypothetical protein